MAAAAKGYFGIELKDLTLAQAAIISALPKSPSTYDLVANAVIECVDPAADPETCEETQLVVPADSTIVLRRNLVLDLMAAPGGTPLTGSLFTADDFAAAKAEPVVLAPQRSNLWKVPQFVWQVRRELTTRLCGDEAETCPVLERGGLTVTSTIDMRLQGIAEKWVKAAAIVPKAKNPKATARALGLTYEPWMANLADKNLRNGALIAIDYQTGEIVAYQGSADPTATKATKRFQPRYDVLADGWRQPGSAFKPVVYATGIDARTITVPPCSWTWSRTSAAATRRSTRTGWSEVPCACATPCGSRSTSPRSRRSRSSAPTRSRPRPRPWGSPSPTARPMPASPSRWASRRFTPRTSFARTASSRTGAGWCPRPRSSTCSTTPGHRSSRTLPTRVTTQALDEGAAAIMTDILAGNTDPSQNPYWGKFAVRDGSRRRPATLKTGTNNDAKDLNAYGYLGAPSKAERQQGEYALAVGVWNGNSDNSLVSTAADPLFSIDVSTYVWQGFLQEAAEGWSVNGFKVPGSLQAVAVDPWTGLRATGGGVTELFLPGTEPGGAPAADQRCGEPVLAVAGFEAAHSGWMDANRGWLARAAKGPGRAGGPENTRTAYFYNGVFTPYGKSWGSLLGEGSGCATPTPSPTIDPCASLDPFATVDPLATIDPLATPIVCPGPSESASVEPSPSDPPTPAPATPTPPPATPTPTPTPAPPTPTPKPATPTPPTPTPPTPTPPA